MAKFIKVSRQNVLNCTELININFIKTVTFHIGNENHKSDVANQQFTQVAQVELVDNSRWTLKLAPPTFEKLLHRLNNNESDIEEVEAYEDSNLPSAVCRDEPFVR